MEYENEFLDELKEIRNAIYSLKTDELQELENVRGQITIQKKILEEQNKYNEKLLNQQRLLTYWTIGLAIFSFILALIGIISLFLS